MKMRKRYKKNTPSSGDEDEVLVLVLEFRLFGTNPRQIRTLRKSGQEFQSEVSIELVGEVYISNYR